MGKNGKAAVIEAKRSPVGRMPGGFSGVEETVLLAHIFREVSKSAAGVEIQSAVTGSSFPNERDNLCRKAILCAGLPETISCVTISKTCASSDEALAAGYYQILADKADCILVGGIEKSNNSSYILGHMKETIKKQIKEKQPFFQDVKACIQENDMALIAEMLARNYKITREQQDNFTLCSIRKALEAEKKGYFKEEILSVSKDGKPENCVSKDEMFSTSREGVMLHSAKPLYLQDGTLTQYNTAPVCEGAAAMLIMNAAKADESGVHYEYFIRDIAMTGVAKQDMGRAMSVCVEEILRKNHLTLSDMDLIEINESSAAQAIFILQQLGLEEEKVNVNGGNLAIGYPIGMTGMRMNISLLYELKRRKAAFGLSVICAGGNMANAVIFQRKDS